MRTAYIYIFCIALYAGFAISACSSDPTPGELAAQNHTEGQELNDLKTARNRGAISADEYEDQKEEIFDRYED